MSNFIYKIILFLLHVSKITQNPLSYLYVVCCKFIKKIFLYNLITVTQYVHKSTKGDQLGASVIELGNSTSCHFPLNVRRQRTRTRLAVQIARNTNPMHSHWYMKKYFDKCLYMRFISDRFWISTNNLCKYVYNKMSTI